MQRTSGVGFQQDLHKVFSQGPARDHSALGSPPDLLTRTCTRYHALQGPLRGFHQDLYKICAQGTDQDLHAKTPRRISQDHHQGTCCWRGSYKILIEEPLQGLQIIQIHMFSACLVAKFDQKKWGSAQHLPSNFPGHGFSPGLKKHGLENPPLT